MVRTPRISARQAIGALEKDGWVLVRTKGSHMHFKHPVKPGLVTIPVHRGETLYPQLLKSILRQADLSDDDLKELLK